MSCCSVELALLELLEDRAVVEGAMVSVLSMSVDRSKLSEWSGA
jgi:hypothetical protein